MVALEYEWETCSGTDAHAAFKIVTIYSISAALKWYGAFIPIKVGDLSSQNVCLLIRISNLFNYLVYCGIMHWINYYSKSYS